MKDNSVNRLGGIASILVGISYVVVGITGVLIPSNLGGVPDVQSPFMHWEANKGLLLTQWWALLMGAVFALAVIPALSATVQHANEGLVPGQARWRLSRLPWSFWIIIGPSSIPMPERMPTSGAHKPYGTP